MGKKEKIFLRYGRYTLMFFHLLYTQRERERKEKDRYAVVIYFVLSPWIYFSFA